MTLPAGRLEDQGCPLATGIKARVKCCLVPIYWTATKTSMHQSKILWNKPGGRYSSENWFGGRTASRCPSACSAAGFPSCPGAQSHWSWRTLALPRTWGRCRKASERRQDFGKKSLGLKFFLADLQFIRLEWLEEILFCFTLFKGQHQRAFDAGNWV